MKKILTIFSSILIAAFGLQSCNQMKVDTAKEWASIDSTANVKVMAYRDSLKMSCMNSVMAMATQKSDSMLAAAMKKSPGKKPPVKTTPPPTTKDPKKDKMSGTGQAATEEKKDKMSGTTESGTDKKKDKMKGTKDTIPPPK